MADTFYGTGKRKDAIARVWITPGSGNITIDGKPLVERFPRIASQQLVKACWSSRANSNSTSKRFARAAASPVKRAQVKHGISKALVLFNEELRTDLREIGALTRDPRVKERKNTVANAPVAASSSPNGRTWATLQTAVEKSTAVFCFWTCVVANGERWFLICELPLKSEM
jgi:small subunit ribosomal protein S9